MSGGDKMVADKLCRLRFTLHGGDYAISVWHGMAWHTHGGINLSLTAPLSPDMTTV
jgi:hypothetical protein